MWLPFIASSWFTLHSRFLWKMMFVIWQLKLEVVQGKAVEWKQYKSFSNAMALLGEQI